MLPTHIWGHCPPLWVTKKSTVPLLHVLAGMNPQVNWLWLFIRKQEGMCFLSSSSSSREVWFPLSNVIACKHLSFSPFPALRQASRLSTPVYRGIPVILCFKSIKKVSRKKRMCLKLQWKSIEREIELKILDPKFLPLSSWLRLCFFYQAAKTVRRSLDLWSKNKSAKRKVRNCGHGSK